MPKVLVLVPFPMTPQERSNREAQRHLVKLSPDTELEFRSVKAAPRTYVSHHDYIIADIGIFEAGLQAQKEGYDCICIDTMSDSGMNALRSVLDIPVIGPGRASMLTALMLGDKFSVVAMWPHWAGLYKKTLYELNLQEKCVSVRWPEGLVPDNRNLLGGKEDIVLPKLYQTAMRCIEEDGAEVICLGSTTMHQAHAYLQERLPVPIINPGPLSYKMAETVVALKLAQSRKAYPSPMVPKEDMLHIMLDAAAKAEAGKPLEKLG